MESVEFKRQGLLYYLHAMVFKNDPEDTCTYKRNLIITFCVLLVTIHATIFRGIAFLFESVRDDDSNRGIMNQFYFIGLAILSFMIGVTVIEDVHFIPDFIFWHELSPLGVFGWTFVVMFIGLIALAIGLTIATLAVFILVYAYKGLEWLYLRKISPVVDPSYINDEGKSETQFGVMYQSIKERWCKRITWK